MSAKTLVEAQASLRRVIAENRLICGDWARVEDGRQMLCGLTALLDDPDARPRTCPAWLMPQWAAAMVPFIDDYTGNEHTRLLLSLADLVPTFDRVNWRCVMLRTNLESLRVALPHDEYGVVQPAAGAAGAGARAAGAAGAVSISEAFLQAIREELSA